MELKLNPTKVFKKKKHSDVIVADVSWSYRLEDKVIYFWNKFLSIIIIWNVRRR